MNRRDEDKPARFHKPSSQIDEELKEEMKLMKHVNSCVVSVGSIKSFHDLTLEDFQFGLQAVMKTKIFQQAYQTAIATKSGVLKIKNVGLDDDILSLPVSWIPEPASKDWKCFTYPAQKWPENFEMQRTRRDTSFAPELSRTFSG